MPAPTPGEAYRLRQLIRTALEEYATVHEDTNTVMDKALHADITPGNCDALVDALREFRQNALEKILNEVCNKLIT